MTDIAENSARAHAATLIREAFDRARLSGKSEWHRMTTAVLKNRLLQLTNSEFSIEDYGADTVADFARLFPELVRVESDPAGGPPMVTLTEAQSPGPGEPSPPAADPSSTTSQSERTEIRPDLWRAVMDWNDAHSYVLDPVTSRARRRLEGDAPDVPTINGITKEEYLGWRTDFITNALNDDDLTADDRIALEAWRDKPGPSRDLPIHLQDLWMTNLRTSVASHLHRWYETVGLPLPDDLISERARSHPRGSLSTGVEVAVATRRLREVVRKCVDAMSYDELQSLQLPASVVARALWR